MRTLEDSRDLREKKNVCHILKKAVHTKACLHQLHGKIPNIAKQKFADACG